MDTYQVEVSQEVEADADQIYRVLADYHRGHPNILPKQHYLACDVEQGGVGEGTIIRVTMKALGVKQHLRLFVTEPKPGRLLQEEDPEIGVVTFFKTEPMADGSRSQVSIQTVWKKKKGLQGFIESLINPPVARSIFRKELLLIKAYCEADRFA